MKRAPFRRKSWMPPPTKFMSRHVALKAVNIERQEKRRRKYAARLGRADWQTYRKAVVVAQEGRCAKCQAPIGRPDSVFHVHHKTYVRFGHELIADLEAFCVPCHRAHHSRDWWKVARRSA
jgi:5-methylcytosine-specific restriction endonuclease McrA